MHTDNEYIKKNLRRYLIQILIDIGYQECFLLTIVMFIGIKKRVLSVRGNPLGRVKNESFNFL